MPLTCSSAAGLPMLPFEPPECRPLESEPCDFLDAAESAAGACLLARRSSDTARPADEDARSAAAFDCREVRDSAAAIGAYDADRSTGGCCSGRLEASDDELALKKGAAFGCRPFCFPDLRDRRAAQAARMSLSRDCDLDRLAGKKCPENGDE